MKPMKCDVYMPIVIGDYLKDTMDLTTEEHGAYLLLLMSMWTADGSLAVSRLQVIAGIAPDRWPAVWETVSRFFEVDNGRVTQGRLTKELSAARKKGETARTNGRSGGRPKTQTKPRHEPRTEPSANPDRNPGPNPDPPPEKSSSSSSSSSPSDTEGKGIPLRSVQKPDAEAETEKPTGPGTAYGLVQLYRRLWTARYSMPWGGEPWIDRTAREFLEAFDADPISKAVLVASIKPALDRYFADERDYYARESHPFSVFVKEFNTLRMADRPRRSPGEVIYRKL